VALFRQYNQGVLQSVAINRKCDPADLPSVTMFRQYDPVAFPSVTSIRYEPAVTAVLQTGDAVMTQLSAALCPNLLKYEIIS